LIYFCDLQNQTTISAFIFALFIEQASMYISMGKSRLKRETSWD